MEHMSGEDRLEERVELSMLYDFYGALLKENQQRMFEASILEDYNFSEIASEEGISRQGAYDAIKRASKQLREYEKKLGLVEKFQRQKKYAKELKAQLSQMSVLQDEKWSQVLETLEKILEE